MRFLTVYCATLMTIASTVAVAQTSVTEPEYFVGDRWVFKRLDLWTNEETESYELRVSSATEGSIFLLRTTIFSKSAANNIGRPLRRRIDAATMTFFDPGIYEGKRIDFNFPLDIGKTWEYEFKTKGTGSTLFKNTRKAKVESWEDIRVPAGTFKALKIVHNGYWTRYDVGGTFHGAVTETFWYSPETKWWVKYEYQDRTPANEIWTQTRVELTEIQVKR